MSPKADAYTAVAAEYYDAARHPTCANFAAASRLLLQDWWMTPRVRDGWLCEVGPGKSLVAEEMVAADSHRLVLVDASEPMLAYSRPWILQEARAVVGNALALPFRAATVQILVASLGDAYNVPQFWREVARILKPGGEGFFSSPSYEWAVALRGGECAPGFGSAEFEVAEGEVVEVPSFIHSEPAQHELIGQHGLTLRGTSTVSLEDLRPDKTSPKLLMVGPECPIVRAYLFVKPLRGQ